MPSKNPAQRLLDIRDNIDLVAGFIDGLTIQKLKSDTRTTYAVVRALEIISEASRRLPEDLKERHPHIDWFSIAAAGNVYRHEYEAVDEDLIWATITRSLPILRQSVDSELQRNY